jgi:predicted nucleotidyltransferase
MPRSSLKALSAIAAKRLSGMKDVDAAYVFGSVVTGTARRDSDIDIAVLLSSGASSEKRFRRRLELIGDLGSVLKRSDVDVVILNDASPLLAHRVLSKGKLIFERSASARVRFQVQTANRYADRIPVYETFIRYLKKSVREGRVIG